MKENNKANDYWQIPAFELNEFAEKKNDYCVVVFIINEGQRFLNQLQMMPPHCQKADIVIADGGSTDGSTNPEILKQQEVNTLLVKTGVGKLGAQMRMAFAWALRRGYKGVVVIDGNNKDSVSDIPSFIKKLEEGYDHIQGSRFIPGGYHKNTPLLRLIGVKLLHAPIMRLASGFHYTDTTNGFRAYSARLLKDSRIQIFRNIFSGYELHYYLALKAANLGFKCVEIPVGRCYPDKEKTPTKISPIRGNLTVLTKLFSTVLGKYNP